MRFVCFLVIFLALHCASNNEIQMRCISRKLCAIFRNDSNKFRMCGSTDNDTLVNSKSQCSFSSIYHLKYIHNFQICCPDTRIKRNTTFHRSPMLQAFSMYGVTNENGLIFGSLTISNPSNNVFGSIFMPKPIPIFITQNIMSSNQQPFTFAPLKPSTTTIRPLEIFSSSALESNQVFVNRPESQCGISNITLSRVVGGAASILGQYPWIVALGYRFPNTSQLEFHCAGSLITRKHVLTTSHCVTKYL